jgi:hypothetical protein
MGRNENDRHLPVCSLKITLKLKTRESLHQRAVRYRDKRDPRRGGNSAFPSS